MRDQDTLFSADAGYLSDDNVHALHDRGIPALIADHGMRQRDERFAQQDRHKTKAEVLHDESERIDSSELLSELSCCLK